MKTAWGEKSTFDKAKSIFGILVSIGVVLLLIFRLLGVLDGRTAMFMAVPLVGVILFLHANNDWKEHKWLAIFELCAALFLFVISFDVWFLDNSLKAVILNLVT